MSATSTAERTLQAAERVAAILAEHQVRAIVIGAQALATHGYIRATEDFDLGVVVGDPGYTFTLVARALEAEGFDAQVFLADDSDPLGGVLLIQRDDIQPIEVVNFANPNNRGRQNPAIEGLGEALEPDPELLPLPVISLPYLVAMKLSAGGRGDIHDVAELLRWAEDLDVDAVRRVCADHGLGDLLEQLLAEIDLASS